jgi:hypothetical protein
MMFQQTDRPGRSRAVFYDGALPGNSTNPKAAIAKKLPACFVAIFTAAAMLFSVTDKAEAGGVLSIAYTDATFSTPLVIDNPHWPLNPDATLRTFTYKAETEDGCVIEEATVHGAGPYKSLNGAAPYNVGSAVVVEDIGFIDENCDGNRVKEEYTFDWYRQDDNGNVWYLGELSRIYEDGCAGGPVPSEADRLVSPECYEGSWEAGKPPFGNPGGLVAQAGIVVPSDTPMGLAGEPLTAGTFYLQELAEEAMDVAKVLKTDTKVKFKGEEGTIVHHHCRVTKEYTSLAPGAVEHKNYCPGEGGLVAIEELSGGKSIWVILTDIAPALP